MRCAGIHPELAVQCELSEGRHADHWVRHEGENLNWPNGAYMETVRGAKGAVREMAARATHVYLPHEPTGTQVATAAAVLPKTGTQRRAVYDAIARRVEGSTDEEVAAMLRLGLNSVRPRRLELVEMELVEDSGICRRTQSGHDAIVWRARNVLMQ